MVDVDKIMNVTNMFAEVPAGHTTEEPSSSGRGLKENYSQTTRQRS